MSAPNGRGSEDPGSMFTARAILAGPAMAQFPAERVKEIVAALEVPFDPSQIEWRVMNTTKGQQPRRGQVVPYADQRAYTDRLNTSVHSCRVDAQVHHSHQREFRAKQRSEDRREGARHL